MAKYEIGNKVTICYKGKLLYHIQKYGLQNIARDMTIYENETVEILGIRRSMSGIEWYRLDTPKCDGYVWTKDMFEEFCPKIKIRKRKLLRLLKRGF